MARLPKLVAVVVGVGLVATGLWAMVNRRSFYDAAATFPPYNRHLLHDIGAFLVGLGAAMLVAVRLRRGLSVALVGNAAGAVLHAVSHIVDRHLGGRSTDPLLFTVLAVVITTAAALALQEE